MRVDVVILEPTSVENAIAPVIIEDTVRVELTVAVFVTMDEPIRVE